MPNVDLPLSELQGYKPASTAESDFDDFWEKAKKESSSRALNAHVRKIDYPAKNANIYETIFEGADGAPIHGWYVVPQGNGRSRLPGIIRFHGYNGNRAFPHELLHWSTMGIAALAIDTRGQGGLTPDYASYPTGGIAGWMTLGILDPRHYYYRMVYLDCVRAIDFLCSRDEIDATRIAVYGASQGGGLALAAAGLDDRLKLAMPVYPYLCHFRRGVEMHNNGPFVELKNWFRRYDPEHLKEAQVYRTLSYFDGMNHAARVKARTLMAITLQDNICPPSTCFAAYNHVEAEKELRLYHDYGHEPLSFHEEAMMRFVEAYL